MSIVRQAHEGCVVSLTPPSPTSAPPRRRWRRWLAGAVLAAVALVWGGVALDRWLADRDWRAACAEADALDPGWRWDELRAALPALPADRDAAKRIRAIGPQVLAMSWPDWQAAAGTRGNDFSIQDRIRFSQRLHQMVPARQLSAEQAALLRIELGRAAALVRAALELTDCPGGRPRNGVTSPLAPQFGDGSFSTDTGQVTRLLYLHVTLLAHDGRADDALAACRAIVAAGRASADEPSGACLGALEDGSAAQRVLGLGEPGDAVLAALQDDLLARPLLRQTLRGWRAILYDLQDARDAGRLSRDDFLLCTTGRPRAVTGIAAIDDAIDACTTRRWGRGDAATLVRYVNRLVETVPATDAAPVDYFREFEAALAQHSALPAPVRHMAQTIAWDYEYWQAARAAVLSAHAARAAERFRRCHGRWPAELQELVPAYLAAVPQDPFTSRPLLVRRTADGLVVYSVGPDGTDDGGMFMLDQTNGRPNTDIGFRL
jgi:hypothetical protein